MTSIIVSLIILGVLVTVHEGGHFIAARLCGITVEKFSIGFGKPIFKFIKGGVQYSLAWIPLGGYVKMKGDNPDSDSSDPDTFLNASWWKRVIVAFAGPFTNLLFAFLVIIVSFMFPQKTYDHPAIVDTVAPKLSQYLQAGDEIVSINNEKVTGWYDTVSKIKDDESNSLVIIRDNETKDISINNTTIKDWANYEIIRPIIPAVVGDVIPNSSAYLADINEGDLITKVGDVEVGSWYSMTGEIAKQEDEFSIIIMRDGKEITKTLSKRATPESDRKLIGIMQDLPLQSEEHLSPVEAITFGSTYTIGMVVLNYKGIYSLIKKPSTIKGSVGGPVMMFTTGQKYAKQGIAKTLQFIGLLNIVLMVMNLLPIPVLDGGHILFSTIEGIRGKRLTQKTQIVMQQLGMFFLLSLMMYAFYSDFSGILSRYMSN